MTADFWLFCKSFAGDLSRVQRLVRSVEQHNTERLPFAISVPQKDMKAFRAVLPASVHLIADESIDDPGNRYVANERLREMAKFYGEGWIQQQFVKGRFYTLNLADFYLCLDSDNYFISDFARGHFMVGDVPYMTFTELQVFREWSARFNRLEDHKIGMDIFWHVIRQTFQIDGKMLWNGPAPTVWSTDVWREMDTRYTLEKLFSLCPVEQMWYGAYYLYLSGRRFLPTEPFFKCFHTAEQYRFYQHLGYTDEEWRKVYLGVVEQANWNRIDRLNTIKQQGEPACSDTAG